MGQALFGVAGALDRAGRVRPPRSTPRRRTLVTAANQATFAFVPAAIGPLALILTVAAVQAVGRRNRAEILRKSRAFVPRY
jgi:hypothetical protein